MSVSESPGGAVSFATLSSAAPWRQQNRLVLRRWAAWFSVSVAAILFCIAFVDHPVARFMQEHPILPYHGHRLSFIPVAILAGASASVVLIGIPRAFYGELPLFWRRVLFAGLACCVALTLKTEAKYLLGRMSPEEWYWLHQVLPFVDFRPLHREGSFPSGHMTAMWSIAPFVWVRYRWLRVPWILASVGAAFALSAAGAHFVSDLIAGCLLGGTVGYLFLLAAERRQPSGDGPRL
jgi:membrane-associated phospholipid phosphatase